MGFRLGFLILLKLFGMKSPITNNLLWSPAPSRKAIQPSITKRTIIATSTIFLQSLWTVLFGECKSRDALPFLTLSMASARSMGFIIPVIVTAPSIPFSTRVINLVFHQRLKRRNHNRKTVVLPLPAISAGNVECQLTFHRRPLERQQEVICHRQLLVAATSCNEISSPANLRKPG